MKLWALAAFVLWHVVVFLDLVIDRLQGWQIRRLPPLDHDYMPARKERRD